MSIITIRNLHKRYGSIRAVDGVDLDIEERECFGLLGPNGAGKTTLVRMLIGVSPITAGTILVEGKDITRHARQIKARLGVVPQEETLDPDLSVLDNLITYARYFDIPKKEAKSRAVADLEFFELDHRLRAKIDELSGGMKRRLMLARGLINRPTIMVLDEPSVGLDPQSKHLMWQKIRSLKDQGLTLVLTTQNMEEAWRLCDRLAVMCDGKIIALGAPRDLVDRYGGKRVFEVRPSPDGKAELTAKLRERSLHYEELQDTIYIFEDDGQRLDDVLERIEVLDQHVPTLEDVFLRLTGRSIQE